LLESHDSLMQRPSPMTLTGAELFSLGPAGVPVIDGRQVEREDRLDMKAVADRSAPSTTLENASAKLREPSYATVPKTLATGVAPSGLSLSAYSDPS
jgi:hypothetical protein